MKAHMENMVEVRNLCKNYNTFSLKNVNFSLPEGSIMGFIGENGAGKTTTIKLLLNEVKRDGGKIRIFGMDNIKDEIKIKSQIGTVFDESYFYGGFTVEDIERILKNVYKTWDSSLYAQYLRNLSLPRNKRIKEFSKGMKMKLSIASALSHHPRLLILDEATSGLDPVMRSEILDVFLNFIQDEKCGVLFSSHITSDLEKVADYVTFIHNGSIVFSSSKDELADNFGILKCGASEFPNLDHSDFLRWRKGSFECEALVKNKAQVKRKYPDCIVDNATLDEIMLFYIKGEKV